MQSGEVGVVHRGRRDLDRIARHEIDHARRQPRLFQQPVGVVPGEDGVLGRLPQHSAPDHRRDPGEVGADGREVEGADRVHEALQGPVLDPVPDAPVRDRLMVEDPLGEVGAEAEEIDDLASGVDLGLKGVLALPEHGGRVERRTPRFREQFGRLEEHRRAVLPAPRGPLPARLDGVGDRPARLLGAGCVPLPEPQTVVVRGVNRVRPSGADLLAPDDHGDVRLLAGDGAQRGLQFGTLGGARRVGEDGFVDRRGNTNRSGHFSSQSCWLAGAPESPGVRRTASFTRARTPGRQRCGNREGAIQARPPSAGSSCAAFEVTRNLPSAPVGATR